MRIFYNRPVHLSEQRPNNKFRGNQKRRQFLLYTLVSFQDKNKGKKMNFYPYFRTLNIQAFATFRIEFRVFNDCSLKTLFPKMRIFYNRPVHLSEQRPNNKFRGNQKRRQFLLYTLVSFQDKNKGKKMNFYPYFRTLNIQAFATFRIEFRVFNDCNLKTFFPAYPKTA